MSDFYFAYNLKQLRIKKGVSRKEVAEYLGISAPAYGRYEKEEAEPTIANLIKLAQYFEITIDELLMFKLEER